MSLDVCLYGPEQETDYCCPTCGNEHKHSVRECFYNANITHNLNVMAGHAGLYDCMWRPEEHGLTKARQLIEPLEAGLKKLQDNRKFSRHSTPRMDALLPDCM